jgi:hypothetical protein
MNPIFFSLLLFCDSQRFVFAMTPTPVSYQLRRAFKDSDNLFGCCTVMPIQRPNGLPDVSSYDRIEDLLVLGCDIARQFWQRPDAGTQAVPPVIARAPRARD